MKIISIVNLKNTTFRVSIEYIEKCSQIRRNTWFYRKCFIADREVAKILTEVKVTMREAEIKLDETDFDEKKLINKRKNLILQGEDPDEVEKKIKEMKKLQKKNDNRKFTNKKKVFREKHFVRT